MAAGRLWSAEETDLLIALWREDHSEGEIARRLNRSRSAIGGKLQRERGRGRVTFVHPPKPGRPWKWGSTASGKRRRKQWKGKRKPMAPPPPEGITTLMP